MSISRLAIMRIISLIGCTDSMKSARSENLVKPCILRCCGIISDGVNDFGSLSHICSCADEIFLDTVVTSSFMWLQSIVSYILRGVSLIELGFVVDISYNEKNFFASLDASCDTFLNNPLSIRSTLMGKNAHIDIRATLVLNKFTYSSQSSSSSFFYAYLSKCIF